ncbi:hypothetical protein Agub_g8716 [Astrephomene gubernaculifera]|uniref:F-box domain-containing protein n=1 Tax=Astrephomene gubernaculifera TaxID=47775 RepID=A0AAD3HNG4_9CHLO|nr:hypothetical protein Agub_g8716 [Astrephomene gubernaculifera]
MMNYLYNPHSNCNKTLQAASALRRRCDGAEDMTLAKLIEICKESGLPTSPLAVTRLELNCQLFTSIGECIAEYRDVQQLHLDRNRISRIENLTSLVHLRCLYLQGNSIRVLEGLEGLLQLQLLNLSSNALTRLEGLAGLPRLEALLVADNQLADGPSIQHLTQCTALCELDLGHNRLADAEAVLRVLADIPQLQTLTLAHNPLAATTSSAPRAAAAAGAGAAAAGTAATATEADAAAATAAADEVASAAAATGAAAGAGDVTAMGAPTVAPALSQVTAPPPLAFYRRTVVARCRQLTALDHRAIFPQERRYAEAWWEDLQRQEQERRQLPDTSHAGLHGCHGDGLESRRMTAATTSTVLGVAACAGVTSTAAPLAAEADAKAPDGAKLPMDVLYSVLSRLDARCLVMAALACRSWCAVAVFPLARMRLQRAQAALCDAAAAVPRLAGAITDVRRDELDELLASGLPARPLVQLFFALEVLWQQRRRRAVQDRRGGHAEDANERAAAQAWRDADVDAEGAQEQPLRRWQQQQDEQGQAAPAGANELFACKEEAAGAGIRAGSEGYCEAEEACAARGSEGEQCLLGPGSDMGGERGSDAQSGSGGMWYAGDEADDDGDRDDDMVSEQSDLDLDFDSQTWRTASWEAAQELLRARDFPLPTLLEALPLGPRALAALRCRTGSADDLDFYVPQLRAEDVVRHNTSAGRLAEWLLGVEAHCRAAHELDDARAWSWPGDVMQRTAGAAQPAGSAGGGSSGATQPAGGATESSAAACAVELAAGKASCSGGLGVAGERGEGGSASREHGAVRDGVQDASGGCVRQGRWPSAGMAAAEMRRAVAAVLAARRAEALARAAEAERQAAAAAAAEAAAVAAVAAAAVGTGGAGIRGGEGGLQGALEEPGVEEEGVGEA